MKPIFSVLTNLIRAHMKKNFPRPLKNHFKQINNNRKKKLTIIEEKQIVFPAYLKNLITPENNEADLNCSTGRKETHKKNTLKQVRERYS